MEAAPRCVFTQRGKVAANDIENTFEKSPIPKKVINIGSIATGGNALNTFNIGVKIKFNFWFLPVSNPNIIPIEEPISKPDMPLQIEEKKSTKNSPDFVHSTIPLKIFVGGGIRVEFKMFNSFNNCHSKMIPKTGSVV